MKKMMSLSCIASLCITLLSACNSEPKNNESEKLSSPASKATEIAFEESSSYNHKIPTAYALACIKAYDSIYDIKNICKNEKAIAKAFTKSITFPRHIDSLDIAKWIANLAQDPVTKDYVGVRIRLGIYVDPKATSFNLTDEVITKITAADAKGNNKVGRLTAFLWAYKIKGSSSLKVASDSTSQEDLGDPLNLGDLNP